MITALAVVAVVAATPDAPVVVAQEHAKPLPVLLVPGFLGWRSLSFMGGAYFGGLKAALEKAGADVYEVAPPPVASSAVRGAFVVRAIDDVLLRTGADRVVIIAHSQGGLDVRDAIARGAAAKIAVVATLSSPHEGTDLADAALAWFPPSLVQLTLDQMQSTWESEQHVPHLAADAAGALASLSRGGAPQFRAHHADTGGVPFFSLAAASGDDVDGSCASGGRWGKPTSIDALHPLFAPARWLIRGKGGDVSDDGVVPTRSMRFGTYLGCVAADHVDWMGWRLFDGDDAFDAPAFVVELWRGMNDVADAGGDVHAIDAHIPALAKLAHAVPVETTFATR